MKSIPADKLEEYFDGVAKGLIDGNFRVVLESCVKPVHQSIRDNFTSSADANGQDWPERKVEGDGHPLLMDTGALLQAATGGGAGTIARVGERELEWGVDLDVIPYARAHNLGNPGNNLPQREFLDVQEEHKVECGEAIADHGAEVIF